MPPPVLFDTGYLDFFPDEVIAAILSFIDKDFGEVYTKLVWLNEHIPEKIKHIIYNDFCIHRISHNSRNSRLTISFDDLISLSDILFLLPLVYKKVPSNKKKFVIAHEKQFIEDCLNNENDAVCDRKKDFRNRNSLYRKSYVSRRDTTFAFLMFGMECREMDCQEYIYRAKTDGSYLLKFYGERIVFPQKKKIEEYQKEAQLRQHQICGIPPPQRRDEAARYPYDTTEIVVDFSDEVLGNPTRGLAFLSTLKLHQYQRRLFDDDEFLGRSDSLQTIIFSDCPLLEAFSYPYQTSRQPSFPNVQTLIFQNCPSFRVPYTMFPHPKNLGVKTIVLSGTTNHQLQSGIRSYYKKNFKIKIVAL